MGYFSGFNDFSAQRAVAEKTKPESAPESAASSVDIGSAKSCRARAQGQAMTHDQRIGSGQSREGTVH